MGNIIEFIDLGNILWDCFQSLNRVAIGVLLAILTAVPLGLLRSSMPDVIKKNKVFKFLVDAPKFPPPIAWIPLVILLFGIGEKAAYIIVMIGAFSPIFTNTYEGAESIPVTLKNVAHSFELKGIRYVIHISYPYSLPYIFIGIKSGVGMGWMSVIAAEMVSGQSGLGYSIQLNRLNLQYSMILLDIFLIGMIGYLLLELVILIEKRVLKWHVKTKRL